MWAWLDGKKTYIVAVAGMGYAASGYFLGHIELQPAAELFMMYSGLGALRSGMAKIK